MNKRFIPYGRQSIDEEDIRAVTEVLESDWITQGPAVRRFEEAVAEYCGARYAVAVSNGTAALHLAALAAGFAPGDEVITSPITFVASANCILYCGAAPRFADIDTKTVCLDPGRVVDQVSSATRGIIPVHFAGHPCDMETISRLAKTRGLVVIEDAAHAIGASYSVDGQTFKVGACSHSDMTIFSFHPVKHLTTGEGGMITTNDEVLYRKLLLLRTHGITKEPSELKRSEGPWYYEMQDLGFNYRITDIQCALGRAQLKKLDRFVRRRREIVEAYNRGFSGCEELIPPEVAADVDPSWHLYVVRLKTLDRLEFFNALRARDLGVNVHYFPVHLQPYYREKFGFGPGDYPVAESYYENAVTLPLYPDMTDTDVETVIDTVLNTIGGMSS